jgi:hypothetical protein
MIDHFLDFDVSLSPFQIVKASPETLRELGFATSASDNLSDGQTNLQQCVFESADDIWKVDAEDRPRVRCEFDLKASCDEAVEHYSAAISRALL